MRKRPMAHLALAFLLGDVLYTAGFAGVIIGGIILFIDFLYLKNLRINKIKIYLFCLSILIAALSAYLYTGYISCHNSQVQAYLEQRDELIFEGKLCKKEFKNEKLIYYINNARTKEGNIGKIILYPDNDDALIGAYICGKGKRLDFHHAENEGGFNEEQYYYAMGICAKVVDIQFLHIDDPVFSVDEALYKLRSRMSAVFGEFLPGEESGLLAMMALGDSGSVVREAKLLFSEAGLSHMLAISGLHISLIGMGLFGFLRKSRIPVGASAAASTVFVFLYARMAGSSTSTVRAAGMFFLMMLASALGLAYDTASALSAMALVILCRNPKQYDQASFVLSFGAIIGIVFVANICQKSYESLCKMQWEQTHKRGRGRSFKKRFHQRIISLLVWGIALQMSMLPIVAYFYFEVPAYVVVLNILLLPFLGALLGFGLVGGFIGVFSPLIGRWILLPCHYILYFYEKAAALSVKLPHSSKIIGRPYLFAILLYYLFLFLAIRKLETWMKEKTKRHARSLESVSGRISHQIIRIRPERAAVPAVITVFLLFFIISLRPCSGFEVAMLYVGQGDGIFIDSGMGERYMIDGGSTSEKELGRYTLLPFLKSRGIGRVDAWFLTHMDEDHVSGFFEVVEQGYPVRALILAKSIEKTGRFDELISLCRNNGVRVVYMAPGDSYVCTGGLIKKKKLVFECLAPEHPAYFEGPNENSLVLGLHYQGFDGVFTGDIGVEQEERLVDTGGLNSFAPDGKIELLKSAHHGSNGSNAQRWLSALSPELVIISAGRKNRYGHPGAQALSRMDELGLRHLCTIDCGQISVFWRHGSCGVRVKKYDEGGQKRKSRRM